MQYNNSINKTDDSEVKTGAELHSIPYYKELMTELNRCRCDPKFLNQIYTLLKTHNDRMDEKEGKRMHYDVLIQKMNDRNVTAGNIAKLLGTTKKAVLSKLYGSKDFSYKDAILVRDAFFPDEKLDHLFDKENTIIYCDDIIEEIKKCNDPKLLNKMRQLLKIPMLSNLYGGIL